MLLLLLLKYINPCILDLQNSPDLVEKVIIETISFL